MALGSAALIGVGHPAAATHQTVTAVQGSAYGFFLSVSLFGGPANVRGPSPTVTLASDASNSPQTATAPSGSGVVGPATFFSSGQLDVSTSGSLGETGGVTSTTNVANVNTSRQESFTASNVASTCTSDTSGRSASTTITGGTLDTDSGNDLNGDGNYTDPGEHPPVTVAVPTNPGPNTPYDGHIHVNGSVDSFRYVFNEQVVNADGSITVYAAHEYLLGPTAVGDLFIGKSTCGATLAPVVHPNDLAVGDITDSPDPVAPLGSVTYTIPVTNNGPGDASGATLVSTLSGVRGASVTSATVPGGTCTVLKGKTKGASCTLGTLASGATVDASIVVAAPRRTGTITLTSTVSSTGDPNAGNDSAFEDTVVARPV